MEMKYYKNIESIATITIATRKQNQETGETFEHTEVIERIGEYNELLRQIALMANVKNYTIETYIISVSTAQGQIEITAGEYDKIISVIRNAPQTPKGFGYRLKDDLTWELYLLPIVEENEEEIIE